MGRGGGVPNSLLPDLQLGPGTPPHPSPLSVVIGAPLRPVLGALPFSSPRRCWARPRFAQDPYACVLFPGPGQGPLLTLHSVPQASPPTSSTPPSQLPPCPALGEAPARETPSWGLVVLWPRRLLLTGQWRALQPAAWSGPKWLGGGERRAPSQGPSSQPCRAQLSRAPGRLSLSSTTRPQSPHLEKPFLDPLRLMAFSRTVLQLRKLRLQEASFWNSHNPRGLKLRVPNCV